MSSSGDDVSQNRKPEDTNNEVTSPNVHELKEPEAPLSSETDPPNSHEVMVMSDDEENVTTAQAETQDKADKESVEVIMPENQHNNGSETGDNIVVISDNEEEEDNDYEDIEDFLTRVQAAATLCMMMPEEEHNVGPETDDNVIIISDDEEDNYFDEDDYMTAETLCMMSESQPNGTEDNMMIISDDEDEEKSVSGYEDEKESSSDDNFDDEDYLP